MIRSDRNYFVYKEKEIKITSIIVYLLIATSLILLTCLFSILIFKSLTNAINNELSNSGKLQGEIVLNSLDKIVINPDDYTYNFNLYTSIPIFDQIIEGIIDGILGPVLEQIQKLIEKFIMEFLLPMISVIIYQVIVEPLIKFIYLLTMAFSYIAGHGFITGIFENGVDSNGDKIQFYNRIPLFFWATTIVVPLILIIIIFIKWISITFNKVSNPSEQFTALLGNVFKMFLAIVLLPVGFFVMGLLAQFLFQFINLAFTSSLGGNAEDTNFSISDMVYYSGDFNWDGKVHLEGGYLERYQITNSPESWMEWGKNNNVFVMAVVGILTLIGLAIVLMTVFLKIYEVALLFFVAPIIAAMYPLDGGDRIGNLLRQAIGKMLIPTVSILSFFIFQIVNKTLNSVYAEVGQNGSGDELVDAGLIVSIRVMGLLAGIWFMITSSSIVGQFIGENTGIKDSIQGIKNTTTTAMAPFSGGISKVSTSGASKIAGKGMRNLG